MSSRGRAINVALKLLPVVIRFKMDRKEWVRKEGKNVREEKMRKNAAKAVDTFIRLGPSFVKLGQWLSTRADLLPQPWMEEFAKLQDNVPPASFDQVKPVIEKELGSIEEAFEYFDTECLSGASLGQVYRARYRGRDVIVKVNRPGIHEMVERDINVLKKLLPIAIKFVDRNIAFSAESMFLQFIESVYEEMDYTIEAENLLRIKRNLKGERVIIPDVIKERSGKSVLTLEYIPGIKVTDIEQLEKANIDRVKLVVRIHRLFFKMLLHHDIFHADPHPGNIAVTPDGSIILYDFGMVGRLDNDTRMKLVRLYLSLIEKEPSRTVDLLFMLGALSPDANRYVIEKGIELAIRSLYGTKVDEMEVKALMELSNKTMTRFPFRLPKQLALYMRMASMLEGIYILHKVDFKFVKVLRTLLEEEGLMKEAYIEEVKDTIERIGKGLRDTVAVAPMLRTFLENNYMNGYKSKHSIIAGSILSSSVVVGSAIMMQSNSLLGQIGLAAAAAIMGISIMIEKRH